MPPLPPAGLPKPRQTPSVCCGFDNVKAASPPKTMVLTEPSVEASRAGVTTTPEEVSVWAVTVPLTATEPAWIPPVVVSEPLELSEVVVSGCTMLTPLEATVMTALPAASASTTVPSAAAGVYTQPVAAAQLFAGSLDESWALQLATIEAVGPHVFDE